MRDTSTAVYHEIMASGLLTRYRRRVFECIYRHGPISIGAVVRAAKEKGLREQVVSPRFAELQSLGVITEVGHTIDAVTGMRVLLWDITGKSPVKPEKRVSKKARMKELEKLVASLEEELRRRDGE